MGCKNDGLRLLHETNAKYDNKIINRAIYENQVKFAINLIGKEDEETAEKVARSHGYTLQEVLDEYK